MPGKNEIIRYVNILYVCDTRLLTFYKEKLLNANVQIIEIYFPECAYLKILNAFYLQT